jgi:hypothetical protein
MRRDTRSCTIQPSLAEICSTVLLRLLGPISSFLPACSHSGSDVAATQPRWWMAHADSQTSTLRSYTDKRLSKETNEAKVHSPTLDVAAALAQL